MLRLAFLFALAIAANANNRVLDQNFSTVRDEGFCSPGTFRGTVPASGQPTHLKQWGSFCKQGDQTTGNVETSLFTAPAHFSIYLAGYLRHAGLTLEIENIATGARLEIIPRSNAAERWIRYNVALPASWQGKPVRFVARDDSFAAAGWFAFSEPVQAAWLAGGEDDAISLFSRTLLYFALTLIPALAIGAFAIRKGARDLVIAGLIQLAAVGAVSYLSFLVWFAAHQAGDSFSVSLPILSGIWFAWTFRKLDASGRQIIKRLLLPWVLCGAASLLIVSDGFAYGGLENPLRTAAERFSHPLPGDNQIPFEFAEALRKGHIPIMQAHWKSSDRPPLQTGSVLSETAFFHAPRPLAYTVLSTILQSLWLFGAWLLLTAFGVNVRAAILALLVCLFSGFIFLNSFFVWPKLFAAAYMLGLLALLFTPRSDLLRNNLRLCMLAGILLAMSLLGHGGSAFAVIGVVLTMVVLRRALPIKSLAVVLLTALVIYTPWILYQKICDPPGNRLLKMHLAGVDDVDPRGFWEAFFNAYRQLTPKQILANKLSNIETQFETSGSLWNGMLDFVRHPPDRDTLALRASPIRGWMFYFFVVNLGFLMFGPFALINGIRKKRRNREWRAAAMFWIYIAITVLAWCLVMFRPGSAVIHQGTYVTVILGYVASMLALWAVSRVLAVVLACLQIALNVLIYDVFGSVPPPNVVWASYPPSLGCIVLCAVATLLIIVVSRQMMQEPAVISSKAPAKLESINSAQDSIKS